MSDDDKELRRRQFLEAAHALFGQTGELPSVEAIASHAGLAKGTVYRYFKTKEEIFVALLEDDFSQLYLALEAVLQDLPEAIEDAPAYFAPRFTQSLQHIDNLLPLAALAYGVLEKNIPAAPYLKLKKVLAMGLHVGGKRLESRYPQLAPGQGATLILHTYSLGMGLWQTLSCSSHLQTLLQTPELSVLNRDFPTELENAIRTLWQGQLTARATS